MDKVLPLWFALAVFHSSVHPCCAYTAADDVWPLQAILDNEASMLTGRVVTARPPRSRSDLFRGAARGPEAR